LSWFFTRAASKGSWSFFKTPLAQQDRISDVLCPVAPFATHDVQASDMCLMGESQAQEALPVPQLWKVQKERRLLVPRIPMRLEIRIPPQGS
jgi:hypothetical protein